MNQDLADNLRLLCSYYKSVAEVCRRLSISRPQFNRYLSGRHRPSANTLRRICDFFGVEEYEILLPHSQFQRLVQLRPKPDAGKNESPLSEHFQRLQQQNSEEIDKYLGYYFEYYLSMAAPGKILRTLVCLERQGDSVFYQRTERFNESGDDEVSHSKYLGIAHFLTDRIFLTDYETLALNEITHTILYPTFKRRVARLTGLRVGAASSGERVPCASRVIYDFLGAEISVRQALKLCGLYAFDSEEIDQVIRQAVVNDQPEGQWHFRAKH